MPAAARKGDAGVIHCSGYTIATGSPNVLVNGQPVARVNDLSTEHLFPAVPCLPHTAPIAQGSATVRVNNRALARVGDPLAGCTQIAQGSPNVFVG